MLNRLAIHGFRNLLGFEWVLSGGSHLLVGGNGAGKTSLLEAVYLVATTRSFRTSSLSECVAHGDAVGGDPDGGTAGFSLSAAVEGERRGRLELSFRDRSLERRLDGKSVALSRYLEPLPVVVWSAADSEMIDGAPERRRHMLDRGLVSEDLRRLPIVSRYRQCLRQKRELLKRRQEGLEEWNTLLAAAAADLVAARSAWVASLQRELDRVLEVTALGFPPIRLLYEPSPESALSGAVAIEESLASVMDEERRRRRPVLGPHRDRLRIGWGEHDISEVGSAGERKAVGLLILAAQSSILKAAGRPPTVLADDADSELDAVRLARVWSAFEGCGQVLVSSNRPEVWESLRIDSTWSVSEGSATLEKGT